MTFIAVFSIAFCLDFAYARWMTAVAARRPALAGMWSALIGAAGVVGVGSVLVDFANMIPYLAGLFCGTYWAVRLSEGKEEQ